MIGNNDRIRTPRDGDRRSHVYEEMAEATGGCGNLIDVTGFDVVMPVCTSVVTRRSRRSNL
jgi:hypothetical protein